MITRTNPVEDPLWFQKAVFYELSVRAFHDGNGDGIGDFTGLITKLEYLEWLGVDCIWLLPFQQSPCAMAATTSPTTGRCSPITAWWKTWRCWSRRPIATASG